MIDSTPKGQALDAITSCVLEKYLLETKTTNAVIEARKSGASWSQIGDRLLVAKQNAWHAYRHLVTEESTTYIYGIPESPTGP